MLPGALNQWLDREWLLTNGRGGYASSTIIGCPTRRYHGLLVWNRPGVFNRWVLWSHVAEHVIVDGRTYLLGNFEFNSAIDPHGYQHLVSVTVHPAAPHPSVEWVYRLNAAEVRKRLWLDSGADRVWLRYEVEGKPDSAVKLQVWPLTACREAETLRRKFAGELFRVSVEANGFSLSNRLDPDAGFVLVAHGAPGDVRAQFLPRADWWYNFRYRQEASRGLDWGEDLYVPGSFVAQGVGRLSLQLLAESSTTDCGRAAAACARLEPPPAGPALTEIEASELLAVAARQCAISRPQPDGTARDLILAGYPWLESYTRDTSVGLAGLLLLDRRFDVAGRVLTDIAGLLRDGLLPNHVLHDADQHEYAAADEPLWFIRACDEYLSAADVEPRTESALLAACRSIVDACLAGIPARESGREVGRLIQVDPADGLLICGHGDVACTWMDARVGNRWITPRNGKPVEVNALWYAALQALGRRLVRSDPAGAARCRAAAERVRAAFEPAFWSDQDGYFADVLTPSGPDRTLRPNQLLALSLSPELVSDRSARLALTAVTDKLLTPFGLRTLDPDHPAYRWRYEGAQEEREAAAHQGSVYPWLMGAYISALLRVHGDTPRTRADARKLLEPLLDHMRTDAGLGGISELFDGEPPHAPRGCINQAWSVAEVRRAWSLTEPAAAAAAPPDADAEERGAVDGAAGRIAARRT